MASKISATSEMIKLSLDMIKSAEFGSVKSTIEYLPILETLYSTSLNINPNEPKWINRDRLFMDVEGITPALYSTLFYSGYELTIDDLKRYGQIDSFTPTYYEYNLQNGIEASKTSQDEMISIATGNALCEKYLESICKENDPKSKLINYYTYLLCPLSKLKDGKYFESLHFAGNQKLSKLILLCLDDIDNETEQNSIDALCESLKIKILESNVSTLDSTIKAAKRNKTTTVIVIDNGVNKRLKEILNKEMPIYSKNLVNKLITDFGQSVIPFDYDQASKDLFQNNMRQRCNKVYENWKKQYDLTLATKKKDFINIIDLLNYKENQVEFNVDNYKINDNYCEEEYLTNQKVFNFIVSKTKYILGGNINEYNLTNMSVNKADNLTNATPTGRNIDFSKNINTAGYILNGIALNNMHSWISSTLASSPNFLSSIEYSAKMNLPVTYIFTYDGIASGKLGKTYQNFEMLSILRSIPNLTVLRPCDISEVIGAWDIIIKHKNPTCLIISSDKLNILKHTNGNYVKYGAYIVRKEKEKLDGIIIATGSEVSKALTVAESLYKDSIDIRVISMPSKELFLKQNPLYEEKLLPNTVPIITLEAASTNGWLRFANNKNHTIGINSFGICGSDKDTYSFLEMDEDALYMKIKNIIENE